MFKITLANNQIFTEDKCSWVILPQFPIIKIEYQLYPGKMITMSGFENYIIIKEFYSFLLGKKGTKLDTINLLGKYNNYVYQFSFNVPHRKALQRKGVWGKEFCSLKYNPFIKKFEFGKEQKTNHDLWHKGILTKPIVQLS